MSDNEDRLFGTHIREAANILSRTSRSDELPMPEFAASLSVQSGGVPPTPDEDELFVKIEAAIKYASELGENLYDCIEGRGLAVHRRQIRDELAALRERVGALEADRARFDWLEERGFAIVPMFDPSDRWCVEDATLGEVRSAKQIRVYGPTLREAIDAAICSAARSASSTPSEGPNANNVV